ncbi:MAG: YncE family protein [Terracidiphilus sp.]
MNFYHTRCRLVQAGVALAAIALVAGCGNNYRPTVVPISASGPPAQVTSYAIVVSSTSTSAQGNATIIDYSGDSIMATAPIGPGPTAFTVSLGGSNGYTYNSDGTLSQFPISSNLQQKLVLSSTIPSTAHLVNLFSPTAGLWAADLCGLDTTSAPCPLPWDTDPLTMNYSDMDVFIGNPLTPIYNIPLAPTPVMLVGGSSGGRYFAISQGSNSNPANLEPGNVSSAVACNASPSTVGVNGTVTGVESSNYSTDPPIWVGYCPVYAMESADGSRLFVLNRGSDTISVINTSNNTLDDNCPATNQAGQKINCPVNGTLQLPAGSGPVYAEYNSATNQLIVANYDGGTISVIDTSLDQYGNDSPTFGTTFTIPVGNNPASVTVLYDGSRAYTANQTDQTVTIVNLSSHTVEKTLPVTGHPRTVVSTQNSTQGKVYVAAPDSDILTIIRTDYDIVDTVLPMVGNIVDVRVSTQNGTGGTINDVSRVPGFGQPCNSPGTAATASLAACQALQ